MDNYDSILKEDKVYQEPEPIFRKNKYIKYIFIDLMVVLLILGISYVVYYQTVLSSQNILLYDMEYFHNVIDSLLVPFQLDTLDCYSLEGTINFDEYYYNYDVIRDHENIRIHLSDDTTEMGYYLEGTVPYLQFNDFKDKQYIKSEDSSWLNVYQSIHSNFEQWVNDISFAKKIYFDEKKAIVEVSFTLHQQDINQLLGTSLFNDDVELIFTLKNNAFTDEIVSSKIVINNKSLNTRSVLTYQDHIFFFTDNNGKITKYTLQMKHDDFILKVVKDDILYSILSGTKKENSYLYSYQIIDKIYNLSFDINFNDANTTYKFHSNIEKDGEKVEKSLSIVNTFLFDGVLEEDVSSSMDYSALSEEEQRFFSEHFDDFILPIRKFIDEYKDGID